ncbi:MAG: flavodoxin family protein [Bacillota bacterium]
MANPDRLVIYYSLEGHTADLARAIAEAARADLLALEPEKPLPTRGFLKYLRGGLQALRKEAPLLLPLAKDPAAYRTIFLGTPVWAGHPAPPLWSFLRQQGLSGKRVALFCSCRNAPGVTLVELRAALAGENEIVAEKTFVGRRDGAGLEREAKKWAEEVIQRATSDELRY